MDIKKLQHDAFTGDYNMLELRQLERGLVAALATVRERLRKLFRVGYRVHRTRYGAGTVVGLGPRHLVVRFDNHPGEVRCTASQLNHL